MLQKELEWKVRAIVERMDDIMNDPDTPFHIKEMMDDIKEMAVAIKDGVDDKSIQTRAE